MILTLFRWSFFQTQQIQGQSTGITWAPRNCAVRPASFRAESSVKSSSIESWLFNAILVFLLGYHDKIKCWNTKEMRVKWWFRLFWDGLDGLTWHCGLWSMYVWGTILPVTSEIKQIFQNVNPEFPLCCSSHHPLSQASCQHPCTFWCGGPQNAGHVDNSVINPASQPLPSLISIHNHFTSLWYVMIRSYHYVLICLAYIFTFFPKKT